MTEVTTEAPAVAVADTVLVFELPGITGQHSFDCATIPANVRLDFLKDKVRGYFQNRVNATAMRHAKDATVAAWHAYDEASKADPLQTAVPKPEGERPAAADLAGTLSKAMTDLVAGNVRKMGTGEKKPRERADPLIKAVTSAVVREVFESGKAANPKFTYLEASKQVGKDGVAYLNAMIEKRVAEGVDRTALEKMRDTKYINPAKIMLGQTVGKAISELPSILGL